MNTAEPTEAEVLSSMGPQEDYWDAKERLARERLAALPQPAPAAEEAPWRCEPRFAEIAAEMRVRGLDYDTAREKLRTELATDAKRLQGASPKVAEEIAAVVAAAEQAQSKADDLIAGHDAILQSLEAGIYALGGLRRKLRRIESLKLTQGTAKEIANAALGFFLAKEGTGQTIQNESGWRESVEELIFRQALGPFLADYLATLNAQAIELVKEIRSTATQGKVNLKNFLAVLAAERGRNLPGATLDADGTLFTDLTN